MLVPLSFAVVLTLLPALHAAEEPVAALVDSTAREQIAWYGTLDAALAEAERTERPIFLLSARPEFREIPGFW